MCVRWKREPKGPSNKKNILWKCRWPTVSIGWQYTAFLLSLIYWTALQAGTTNSLELASERKSFHHLTHELHPSWTPRSWPRGQRHLAGPALSHGPGGWAVLRAVLSLTLFRRSLRLCAMMPFRTLRSAVVTLQGRALGASGLVSDKSCWVTTEVLTATCLGTIGALEWAVCCLPALTALQGTKSPTPVGWAYHISPPLPPTRPALSLTSLTQRPARSVHLKH